MEISGCADSAMHALERAPLTAGKADDFKQWIERMQ